MNFLAKIFISPLRVSLIEKSDKFALAKKIEQNEFCDRKKSVKKNVVAQSRRNEIAIERILINFYFLFFFFSREEFDRINRKSWCRNTISKFWMSTFWGQKEKICQKGYKIMLFYVKKKKKIISQSFANKFES